jgi:hypothetical protein
MKTLLFRTLILLSAILSVVVTTPATSQKACPIGYADCDGVKSNKCETNIQADITNCGACGRTCSAQGGTPSCSGGQCSIACSPGYGNCDGNTANGCEAATTNNANACGACGNVCVIPNGTAGCMGTTCVIQSCKAGWYDCDRLYGNGCEKNSPC